MEKQEIQKVQSSKEETLSKRFMEKVTAEFTAGVDAIALTDFQKRLAQNYFIAIDGALKLAEEKRKKKIKNQDPVEITWKNVNFETLAQSVVAAARIGLDPALNNHVSMIPFKDNTRGCYNIAFIEGYRGLEIKAMKYGLDIPKEVVVEVVFANDEFRMFKKDRNNTTESYEFIIKNPFDRGEIVGGFYYHSYEDPAKNKVVSMDITKILKRRPEYASPEFWGGQRDEYVDGRKTGKKIAVEGWYEEMCYKTVYRAAYKDITIDSQKIDNDFMQLKTVESAIAALDDPANEIDSKANIINVDFSDAQTVDFEELSERTEQSAPGQVDMRDLDAEGDAIFGKS